MKTIRNVSLAALAGAVLVAGTAAFAQDATPQAPAPQEKQQYEPRLGGPGGCHGAEGHRHGAGGHHRGEGHRHGGEGHRHGGAQR